MTTILRGWSPKSQAEARATLREMRRNVGASLSNPRVLATARGLADTVGVRDEIAQARAIRAWTCDRFKFQKDPLGVELLETPAYQLGKIASAGYVQGDCDDAAALTAALCKAIGIPCAFRAVAFQPNGPWAHVYTIAYPLNFRDGRRHQVEMDITRPAGVELRASFPRSLTELV